MALSPAVYIETSVPSVLTARPSRDVLSLAHQQITVEWWERALPNCRAYASELVIAELRMGDPSAASKRLAAVAPFPVLPITGEATDLAAVYLDALPVPRSAEADMVHLAIAALNGMNYLLTWNCKHIANGFVIDALLELNARMGLKTPTICTPEELLYEDPRSTS